MESFEFGVVIVVANLREEQNTVVYPWALYSTFLLFLAHKNE